MLVLDNIGLSALPPEISQLSGLRELYLFGNELSTLPPEIGELTALMTIDLARNQLSTLPPEIGQLTALKKLDLGNNQLVTIPPQFDQLTALMVLNLGHNQLITIPPEVIRRLQKLERLVLERNALTALPPELQQLPNLKQLFLHENKGLGLPKELLGPTYAEASLNDPAAYARDILDYYFELQKGERPLNEVKLLLVGRGEAGKTSVSRALRWKPQWKGEKYQFISNQRETPGIDIQPWVLECPGQDSVKVHVWDFAGQEITHETHRYFLTERSLYVVVLDGRGGQQMDEAEYWLSHVQKYGTRLEFGEEPERSPVIVVLNKWNSPGPYDVEKRRLLREYPNIKAFVETDCVDLHGIDKLRETICAVLEHLPAVRQAWPITYFNVKKTLEALQQNSKPDKRKHFLTWEGFQAVCAGCGVTEPNRQQALAENLNSLGLALYYGVDSRLRDTRVLNPNWAANGLYGLVRGVNKIPHRGRKGHLWAGEMLQVLTKGMEGMDAVRGATIEHYPVERDGVEVHKFLLELMVDRELGFPADTVDGQTLYLLPGLLTLDEPEIEKYNVAAHMEAAQVRFRYLYDFLPAGVMSRFIVRTHPLSEDYFRWQRGVVLGHGNARALVMAERRRNPRVDVYITGGTPEERQDLAGVIRSNMEAIHQGLPEGLHGKEELDLTLAGDQYKNIEDLEQLEKENKPVQVVTARGTVELPVTPELEQVQPAEARQEEAPKLRVFVSYSHENYKSWDQLKTYLNILQNNGQVSWWFDGKIRSGDLWDTVIRDEIGQADIVILLMSGPFFASGYINGMELAEARHRHQTGEAENLPVLLEPSAEFKDHKWLSKLQAAPSVDGRLRAMTSFGKPVNGWHHVDVALRELIKEAAAKPNRKRGEDRLRRK